MLAVRVSRTTPHSDALCTHNPANHAQVVAAHHVTRSPGQHWLPLTMTQAQCATPSNCRPTPRTLGGWSSEAPLPCASGAVGRNRALLMSAAASGCSGRRGLLAAECAACHYRSPRFSACDGNDNDGGMQHPACVDECCGMPRSPLPTSPPACPFAVRGAACVVHRVSCVVDAECGPSTELVLLGG